jgi:hypothetical protein
VKWNSLIHVDLENNNLTGRIPHSMSYLSNFLSLNIYDTKLYGEISFFESDGEISLLLKNCQKLIFVNFSGNIFSGNIPNWSGQDVKALHLRSNNLSCDIPQQICQEIQNL